MKKQNGITLMALVLTILIMLVLATISINNLNSTDIINKTETASNIYNQSSVEQDLKMAIAQCFSLYGNLDHLGDFLDNENWTYSAGVATHKKLNVSYNIDADGSITKQ